METADKEHRETLNKMEYKFFKEKVILQASHIKYSLSDQYGQ